MPKKQLEFSRVIAGTNLDVNSPSQSTPHASPINSQINQFSDFINLTYPLDVGNLPAEDLSVLTQPVAQNSGNGSSSPSGQTQTSTITLSSLSSNSPSSYTVYTGIRDDSPTVILSSEFMPVYESITSKSSRKTEQGTLLSIKEDAKVLTAATAINVLTQSLPFKSLVSNNRQTLLGFLNQEGDGISKTYFGSVRNLFTSGKLFTLSVASVTDERTNPPLNIKEILKNNFGYEDQSIDSFSESKLWIQTLHEMKRSFIGYSKSIVDYSRQSTQDSSPIDISKMDSPSIYVLNSLETNFGGISSVASNSNVRDAYSTYVDRLSSYSSRNYCTLSKYQSLVDGNFLGPLSLDYSGNEEQYCKIGLSVVTKEATYSYFLNNTSYKSYMLSDGYDVTSGRQYDFWDYIFGIIPDRVTSDIGSTRNTSQNSLGSFAKVNLSDQTLSVYTFENSIDAVGKPAGSSTGYDYYFLGTIQDIINDPNTNSFTKLQNLIEKFDRGLKRSEILFDSIMSDHATEDFINLPPSLDYLNESVINKLCSENNTPGWAYLKYRHYDGPVADTSGLPFTNDIRVLSCILKSSLNNTIEISNRLKSCLFSWFMLEVEKITANQAQRSQYDILSEVILDSITEIVTKELRDILPPVYQDLVNSNRVSYLLKLKTYDPNAGGRELTDREITNNYRNYFKSVLRRLRDIPLFKTIVSILKSLNEENIYNSSGRTAYSGTYKDQFLFTYFDVILRIISLQTPESFQGFIKSKFGSDWYVAISFTGVSNRQSYFHDDYMGGPTIQYMKKVNSVYTRNREDRDLKLNFCKFTKTCLSKMKISTQEIKNYIAGGYLRERIRNFSTLFTQTEPEGGWPFGTREDARRELTKISLSKEQIRLSEYIYTEICDRHYSGNVGARLLLLPTFKNIFPNDRTNLSDYLPNDSFGLSSFKFLSKYFKDPKFQPLQGINKRIISVGFPPGLLSTVVGDKTSSPSPFVRLKVWKIDRLYPFILFDPKVYHFDTNIFSSKSLENWNSLEDEVDRDPLNVPIKYYQGYNSTPSFFTYRNYTEFMTTQDAASSILYIAIAIQDFFNNGTQAQQIHREMYENQAISFLCEQYLKWYTDTDFSETQYYNFRPIVAPNSSETVYQNVVEALSTQSGQEVGSNTVEFVNKLTGDVVSLPIRAPQNAVNSSIPVLTTPKTVDLTDTTVSYLGEPSLIHGVENYRKQVYYPKKFDRVYNIVVDPDDFVVNQTYYRQLPPELKNQLEGPSGPFERTNDDRTSTESSLPLRRKNTTQGDVSFYEFFVTIEPLSP